MFEEIADTLYEAIQYARLEESNKQEIQYYKKTMNDYNV